MSRNEGTPRDENSLEKPLENELQIEIPLYLQFPRESVRRVEGKIVRRVDQVCNPILPDYADDGDE